MIDDDERLLEPLKKWFERYDLNLLTATHPEQGLALLRQHSVDLVILDIMLPGMDGLEVCRTIRRQSEVPILMLSARGETLDRIIGLEVGADDYLAKPFEPRELTVRIQRILKRTQYSGNIPSLLVFDNLEIDTQQRQVRVQNHAIELTSSEYALLVLLANSPGKNFSRDEILNQLKGYETELFSRAVDIMISRLRQKLQPTDYIKTVWGLGYCFSPATTQRI